MAPRIVAPMEPKFLTSFLSKSMVNKKTINCIITAVKKYNRAVNKAGDRLESDLKKCQNPPVRVKKSVSKKEV